MSKRLSICMLTIDRFEITKRTVEHNLANCGLPADQVELMVVDNGSADMNLIAWLKQIKPEYLRLNAHNEGVARMQNHMIAAAQGEFICLFGNDILMPDNWAKDMIEVYETVERDCPGVWPGLVGIDCLNKAKEGTLMQVNDSLSVVTAWNVFGTAIFNRERITTNVGYLCNRYHPYGLEDSDFHYRLNKAGFTNFYLSGKTSQHIGNDVGEKSEYRQSKWESLSANLPIWHEQRARYDENESYYLDRRNYIDRM
jgi:GT2 family glycosyltransferase